MIEEGRFLSSDYRDTPSYIPDWEHMPSDYIPFGFDPERDAINPESVVADCLRNIMRSCGVYC